MFSADAVRGAGLGRLLLRLCVLCCAGLALLGHGGERAARPLSILLTNDDGWDAPGITAMFDALQRAGHDVTLVAPLQQQSGKGGSFNSAFGSKVALLEQPMLLNINVPVPYAAVKGIQIAPLASAQMVRMRWTALGDLVTAGTG